MAGWYRWEGDDLVLRIRVQPGASRDEIVGPHGGRLRIRITAPPVDGKANAYLIRFLARVCEVPRRRVLLESGPGSREKRLRIQSPETLPTHVSRGM